MAGSQNQIFCSASGAASATPHQSRRQGTENKIVQDSINNLNDRASDRDWGGGDSPRAARALPLFIFCFLSPSKVDRLDTNPW